MKSLTIGLMKGIRMICLGCWVLLLFGGNAFGDCNQDQAKALYKAAMAESDISRKIGLLERSVNECPNFKAYYTLSGVYAETGELKKAEQTLLTARNMTADDAKSMARIFSRLGQIYETMGKDQAAYLSFKESYKHHPYPKVLEKLKTLDTQRMNKGMTSEQIKKALICPTSRSNFQVTPSLDIFINFDFDKATLNPAGRSQSEELGRAISDPVFAGDIFILIGHTDAKGTHEYNDDLSLKRAMTVRDYLSARFPSLTADRLRVTGSGERELLYPDDPENALNRRVEVQME